MRGETVGSRKASKYLQGLGRLILHWLIHTANHVNNREVLEEATEVSCVKIKSQIMLYPALISLHMNIVLFYYFITQF